MYRSNTYNKQLHKGLSECLDDMVDLQVQLIRAEEGSPPNKDGVCDFEDAHVVARVRRGEAADEFLWQCKHL